MLNIELWIAKLQNIEYSEYMTLDHLKSMLSSQYFVILVGVFVLYKLIKWLMRPKYARRDRLLTKCETKMFNLLKPLESSKYLLMAQVRIADVVVVGGREGSKSWWGHFSQISSKHVDFVFVTRDSMKPVVCIELDDKTHDRKSRSVRDQFINKVFKQAGLPLVRFTTKQLFSNTCDFRRLGL